MHGADFIARGSVSSKALLAVCGKSWLIVSLLTPAPCGRGTIECALEHLA